MSDNPMSGKVELDVTNYKAGITELNRQIRVIETGFKASAAAMGDWDKTSVGMESRIKTLTSSIALQQQKVDGLNKVYKELAAGGNTSAKELENLQIKTNLETERLGKMQTELGAANSSLKTMQTDATHASAGVGELADKEEKAEKKTITFKQAMGALGEGIKITATAIAATAAAVVGVGAAIGKLVLDAAKSADELTVLSEQTGISTTRLQELQYVAKGTGIDLTTITDTMGKMIRAMEAASKAGSPAAKAFDELGVATRGSDGKLRDSQAVMEDTLAALGKIPNETERDALAMQIFGKSALELNPLIKAGDQIASLSAEAHKMGAVMSEDSVKGLADFNDTLEKLETGFKGTLGTLAGAFLPGFQAVFGQASGYLQQFSQIVSGSGGDLGKMADGLGQLVGTMANNVAAQAPKLLTAGLNILKGIIAAIVKNLPALLPAVVLILTSLVTFITQTLPILMKAGVQLILALVKGILPQLPALLTAALQIIITLANGITDALPQLMPVIAEVIPQIILTLINMLPLLIDAAAQLILALANGLTAAIPILLPYIPQIIDAIVMALVNTLPILGDVAVKLLMTLYDGIAQNMPLIGKTGGEIIGSIVKGIGALVLQLGLVGAQIVTGIWNGMKDRADWFKSQVNAFFKGIVDGVKQSLGIKSPSSVFAEIGSRMVEGLGVGFTSQFKNFKAQVNQALGGFQGGSLGFAGAGGAGMYQRNSTANYYYGPVTIQQGQAGKPFAQQKASRF